MSWHIGDYKKDTGHLRAAGHGAYFLLTMHYWATGGLPDDDRQLAAIACMSDREWKSHKEIIKAFFKEGVWRHKRIEEELATAQAKYEKRAAAGKQGGKAKAQGKQTPSNATAKPYQPITDNPKEDSEANASADPRSSLFGRGLKSLAQMTGKTPDSCRSVVGKWLKSVNDEAIHVLAAIDDAERNRVADPVAWINKSLQPRNTTNAKAPSAIMSAIDGHIERLEGRRDSEMREAPPRMLPHR